ncbi:MAG TPA: RNA polymerase sporulation sigma factor SigH [Candidatus Anoxymicrobiaceae bacterium]
MFEDLLQETDITGSHYLEMTDKDLVRQAQAEDTKALVTMLERYGEFVRLKGRSYFLVGADREDIIQEGMIGLYKSIRDYREDRETSFKAFAEICITRQIITAIKTATRQKHSPLNSYVSLNNPISEADDPDRLYMDFLASDSALDPAEVVISHEETESIKTNFREMLSTLETQVLLLYIQGRSYQEIADDLDRHVKSIDNALQRIKRKVEQHLQYRENLARGILPKGHGRRSSSQPA